MSKVQITKFNGISPRYGNDLRPGGAVTAEDCDLSGGKIEALTQDRIAGALAGSYNSIIQWDGEWIGGVNACFLPWTIDSTDLLIYLDSAGTLKRRIGDTIVDVGQDAPSAPSPASAGSGSLTGTYYYIITWVRDVDGYQDESGPSDPSIPFTLVNENMIVYINAPTDPNVLYWRLYRASSSTAEYLLVDTVDATSTSYTDSTVDADLGIACPTWYTSNQGNEIIIGKPPTELDGIAQELHSGMILAWKGSTLHFNEPGTPDYWPGIYNINFRTTIKQVIPFAGSIAVLCADGPYRVDGTHPELLQISKPLGREPCLSGTSCHTNTGIFYLSDTGIVQFNLVTTEVVSLGAFPEDWITDNITYSTAIIASVDDKLFVFHSAGTLMFDYTVKQWSTLSLSAVDAVWVNPEDGYLYYLDGGYIKRLWDGSGHIEWTWKGGYLYGQDRCNDNTWLKVVPLGTGIATLNAWIDGYPVIIDHEVDMSSKLERLNSVKFPDQCIGKACQIEMVGNGTVEALSVEYA